MGNVKKIIFDKKNLLSLNENEMQHVRGKNITAIFQEPMTSLNPLHTVEKQINEIKPIFQLLKFNILFKVYLFFFSLESNMSLTKRLSVSILTPSEISILILSSPSFFDIAWHP